MSPPVIEGPVEIGMSLDIASIDAISEINMVYNSFHFFVCMRLCGFEKNTAVNSMCNI